MNLYGPSELRERRTFSRLSVLGSQLRSPLLLLLVFAAGASRLVAEHVAKLVGLRTERVLTGRQLDELHDEALWRAAEQTDLFVEVDPIRKNASFSR